MIVLYIRHQSQDEGSEASNTLWCLIVTNMGNQHVQHTPEVVHSFLFPAYRYFHRVAGQ